MGAGYRGGRGPTGCGWRRREQGRSGRPHRRDDVRCVWLVAIAVVVAVAVWLGLCGYGCGSCA